MDKLANYKLNKAFTEGVKITLDNADVSFMVRLPSPYNRAYSQMIYSTMEWSVDEGKVKTGGGLMSTKWAQEDAFLQHCLISMEGEPIPDGFAEEYPEALAELMTKASDLAAQINDTVETSSKKSLTSSSGSGNGEEKSDSMTDLNAKAG